MLRLDHLVVNTRFDIDAARALFEGLGFSVTPRARHTLGSLTQALVFDAHYLELIGLPRDGSPLRQEIVDSPLGPDGLVFRMDDPLACEHALRESGLDASLPQHFSRPVEGLGEARFVTVRLAPGQLPGGRVYFCQHLTPEYVFRDAWRKHANGVHGILGLHLLDVPLDAYARLGPLASGFDLHSHTRTELERRFAPWAAQLAQRGPRFAVITLAARDPGLIAARAAALGLPHNHEAGRALVWLPQFDTLLECRA